MPREVSHLLIGAVYHPPKANNSKMNDYLLTVLDCAHRENPSLEIMLFGDFNQLPDSQLRSYRLAQIVTIATRGSAILYKIFTDVKSWYQTPLMIPPVGSSDHNVVLLQPLAAPNRPRGRKQTICRCSTNSNGKAMLLPPKEL